MEQSEREHMSQENQTQQLATAESSEPTELTTLNKFKVRRLLRPFLSALALTASLSSIDLTFGADPVGADTGGYPWTGATEINTYLDYGYKTCPDTDANCKQFKYTGAGTYYGDGESDLWGYYLRTCTSYVAWKEVNEGVAPNLIEGLGNAGQWYSRAPANEKSNKPAPGDAAVETPTYDSHGNATSYGHVAYVESINSTDTSNPNNDNITVSEYNYNNPGGYDTRTGTVASLGFTAFVDFGVEPSSTANNGYTSPNAHHLVDFNHDGHDDIALRNSNEIFVDTAHNGGKAEVDFRYGRANEQIYAADFNGDGRADVAVRDGARFFFTYHLQGGVAEQSYIFGRPGEPVYIGDFNGDGRQDIMVQDGANFCEDLAHNGGDGEVCFRFGRLGMQVYVGDFNGDGRSDIALRQGNTFFFDFHNGGGAADLTYQYGESTDTVLVGDYNGDGRDDIVLKRGAAYYPDTSHTGVASTRIIFGRPSFKAYMGDYNSDGRDDIIVQNGASFFADTAHKGGNAEYSEVFGRSGWQVLAQN